MGYFVGSISGTSIDGLDIALIHVSETTIIKAAHTAEFPDELREQLDSLTRPGPNEVLRVGTAHRKLGKFIGERVLSFLDECGVSRSEISAIGSHGQTIRHVPYGELPFSFQIGDGSSIAEVTGIDTVVDFRARDIAANGQGAPLVPIFHEALFRSTDIDRVILNVGGISNITVLPKDPSEPVSGFDTGPGNALLDAVVRHHSEHAYDMDGQIAQSGRINESWLGKLMNDAFYNRPPPKSTGKEHFNLDYVLKSQVDFPKLSLPDTMATLSELTAKSTAVQIEKWGGAAEQIVVCGGGRLNSDLVGRLSRLLKNRQVLISDQLGVDGDAIEAATFAYLAKCFMESECGNVPTVTGATGPRMLGCLYRA